mgnify:CR=1 FL=1
MGLFDFLKTKREPVQEPNEFEGNYSVAGKTGAKITDEIRIDKDTGKRIYKFGLQNNYPSELIGLYDCSPTNQAIINRASLMIAGGDTEIIINDSKRNLFNMVHVVMLQRYPNDTQNLEQILSALAFDLKLHGRYGIVITWNKAHNKVVQLHAVDVQGVRVGYNKDNQIEYKYSRDWTDRKEPVITYEPFDRYRAKTRQLLYVQLMRSGHEVYGLPDYYASLNWINLESQIGIHYSTTASEGFSPKLSVVFPGKPESEDIEDEIMNKLNEKYTGSRGKKIIGIFSPRPELQPEFKPIHVENIDKQYQVIDDQTQAKILTGHGVVSPMLFGIKTAGQLGGAQELQTAFNIYQATVVGPYQNLIQKSIDKILEASNNPNRIELTTFDIISESKAVGKTGKTSKAGNLLADALNSMSPLVSSKVLDNLTVNEIRALGGLGTIEGGDVRTNAPPPPPTNQNNVF